ncbi:MAG: FtsX-like permease family protein, partial [Acidobacteriota bacterium]
VVWQLDPERPMFAVGPMSQSWDWQIARPRFSALLSGVFSLFALLLAAIGLYSVLSFSVSQRGLEIGVRLAFGAERRGLRNMVVGQGMRLVAIGLAVGCLAALGLSRLLESLLFSVGAQDLTTYLATGLVMLASAYVASYLPALRASSVDPAVVLREQ